MTVAWPATIPSPAAKGLTGNAIDTRSKIQMEDGKTRTINRAINPAHVYQVTWLLTHQELSKFKHFFQFDMNDGANWVTSAWLSILGHANHAFKIPAYGVTKTGGVYQLSAVMEVLPIAAIIDPEITTYPVSGAA